MERLDRKSKLYRNGPRRIRVSGDNLSIKLLARELHSEDWEFLAFTKVDSLDLVMEVITNREKPYLSINVFNRLVFIHEALEDERNLKYYKKEGNFFIVHGVEDIQETIDYLNKHGE